MVKKKPHRSTLWRRGLKKQVKTFGDKPIKRDKWGHLTKGTGRMVHSGNPLGIQGERKTHVTIGEMRWEWKPKVNYKQEFHKSKARAWRFATLCFILGFLVGQTVKTIWGI